MTRCVGACRYGFVYLFEPHAVRVCAPFTFTRLLQGWGIRPAGCALVLWGWV